MPGSNARIYDDTGLNTQCRQDLDRQENPQKDRDNCRHRLKQIIPESATTPASTHNATETWIEATTPEKKETPSDTGLNTKFHKSPQNRIGFYVAKIFDKTE
jgi:hypothetical protein